MPSSLRDSFARASGNPPSRSVDGGALLLWKKSRHAAELTTRDSAMKIDYEIAIAIGLVACVTDLRSRRIPNVLTFGSAIAAVVFHTIVGGTAGFLGALTGWGLGVVLFILPFALGGMGGGDVKLLAALGAWLGPEMTVWVALYTGIAGGVLALVVAIAHGYLGQALSNLRLLFLHWSVMGIGRVEEVSLAGSKGPRLAYAVPIFVGTMVALWLH
jgi:prepilin peptidase CpaA